MTTATEIMRMGYRSRGRTSVDIQPVTSLSSRIPDANPDPTLVQEVIPGPKPAPFIPWIFTGPTVTAGYFIW
jgi:hypothetical protein